VRLDVTRGGAQIIRTLLDNEIEALTDWGNRHGDDNPTGCTTNCSCQGVHSDLAKLHELHKLVDTAIDETPVESGSPEPMCLKEFGGYGSCVLREDHTTERCRDAVGNRFMGRKPVTIAEWRAKRGPVDGRYSSHGGVSFT
jgi:hypothetical protein